MDNTSDNSINDKPQLPPSIVINPTLNVGSVADNASVIGVQIDTLNVYTAPHDIVLPPHLNNLADRNMSFSGRDGYLGQIDTALRTTHVSLAGLGGVGKSQIALEYAHRHLKEYDIVWWIKAEVQDSVTTGYLELARALQLPESTAKDASSAVTASKHYLHQHEKWLLIFDNVVNIAQFKEHLPGGGGHIILTTRDQVGSKYAATMRIETWPRVESVAFMKERLGQNEDYELLAADLDDFPLALEQSAAYIDASQITVASFRELLAQRRLSLLDTKPDDYPSTITATWSIAFDAVSKVPLASDILNIIAWLNPGNIPRFLFKTNNDAALNNAIVELRRYSLIDATVDTLSIHRIVQNVIQEHLHEKVSIDEWLAKAISLVAVCYPIDVELPVNWPVCESLQLHGASLIRHMPDRTDLSPESYSYLLNQMGYYEYTRGQYKAARVLFEQSIITEEAIEKESKRVAVRLTNLASALNELGEYASSMDAYNHAFQIDMKVYGPTSHEIAVDLNNIGNLHKITGNLSDARSMIEAALIIDESVLGPDDPAVASRANNLGMVLNAAGDAAGARAQYDRAIKILEKHNATNTPEFATYLNNHGMVLKALKDYKESLDEFERALGIYQSLLHERHPLIARELNNIGCVYINLGDYERAKKELNQAAVIDKEIYGIHHPDYARDMNNLGTACFEAKEYTESIPYFQQAYEIFNATLGEQHMNTKIAKAMLDAANRHI